MPDFIPRRDSDLVKFVTQMSQELDASPEEFGVRPERAAEYSQQVAQFLAAMKVVNDPAARTSVAIKEKDFARDRVKRSTRLLALTVRSTAGMTDSRLSLLGLRPLNRLRTRIARPSVAPALHVVSVHGSQIKVQARDMAALHRTAKPRGVRGISVWAFAGAEPSQNPAEWFRAGDFTRTGFTIDVGHLAAPGSKIWIVARWANPRFMLGPASAPIYTHTQIGVLSNVPAIKAAA